MSLRPLLALGLRVLIVATIAVGPRGQAQHPADAPPPHHHGAPHAEGAQHEAGSHGAHAAPPLLTAEQEERVAAFVERIRAVTERYHDLDAAIGAGYRLVGPDFPGMGEHWVHAQYLLQRELSVERPAILSYLRVGGEPVLTGVAYATPVRSGEDPPDFVLPGLWHFHSGTVDEETLLLNPRSMHHGTGDQPRLAMFHAWVWAENPSGLFAQDNWALPFLRLGLPVPDDPLPQAGKALFLGSDGVDYYARLVDVAGAPSEVDRAAVRTLLEQSHERLRPLLERMRAANAVSDQDQAELAALWDALWAGIEEAVTPALWERIAMLSG
jgi:uncharacterized coiled-coil protein SlyX